MKRDGFGPSAAMLVIVSAALSGCGAELVPTPAESSGTNAAHANGDPRINEAMSKLDAKIESLLKHRSTVQFLIHHRWARWVHH